MAGKKITQLGDGGSLQDYDRIPIARGNINRYLNGAAFATPIDVDNLQDQIDKLQDLTKLPTIISPLTSLPTNHILVGDNNKLPAKRTVSGDLSLSQNATTANLTVNSNAITYNKIQKITTAHRLLGSVATNSDVQEVQVQTNMLEDNSVTLPKLQKSTQSNVVLAAVNPNTNFSEHKVSNFMLSDVSSQTLKGRKTAGTGPVEDLTPAEVRAILNVSAGAGPNVPTDLTVTQTKPDLVHLDSSTQINTGVDILSATVFRAGVMTANDRIKLDGIANGATANTGTVEEVQADLPVKIGPGTSGNPNKTPKVSVDLASPSSNGLLSKEDKKKLDSIGDNANNYSHPNHSGVITSSGDGKTFWNETLPDLHGGTGYTSYGNGDILIGDGSAAGGTTLKKSQLTSTPDIKIETGPGSIKLGLSFTSVGMIAPFFRNGSAPDGWLLCDGSPIPAGTQYDELRTQIGSNTPNLQGMFLVGAGPNPDTSLAHNYAQGSTGGQARVKLTTAEMPVHKHSITDPGHGHTGSTNEAGEHRHDMNKGISNLDDVATCNVKEGSSDECDCGDWQTGPGGKHQHTVSIIDNTTGITETNNEGLSDFHENRPPFFVIKWYIKY